MAAAVGAIAMLLAAMWWGSYRHSKTLQARQDLQAFLASSLETQMALTAVDLPDDVASSALSRAVQELEHYEVGRERWRANDRYSRLSPLEQRELDERLFSLAYLSARNSTPARPACEVSRRAEMLRRASRLVDQALEVGGQDRPAAMQLQRELMRPGSHEVQPATLQDGAVCVCRRLPGGDRIAPPEKLGCRRNQVKRSAGIAAA